MNSRKFRVQTKDNETVHYTKPGKKMTVKEFWEWLDDMDTNGDGVMSSTELEGALRSIGMKFITSWKTRLTSPCLKLLRSFKPVTARSDTMLIIKITKSSYQKLELLVLLVINTLDPGSCLYIGINKEVI